MWMTPPCNTQRTQQSQSISKFYRTQVNILSLLNKIRVRRFWSRCGGWTSLGRGGVFSDLKEQFHVGSTLGCQRGNRVDGNFSSKSWYFVCSHRRWSELVCSRRCLHDHPHQTLEKETSQSTPQFVKTVVQEIMKVESSKQIHSLACCSMTVDSKSQTQHMVGTASLGLGQ